MSIEIDDDRQPDLLSDASDVTAKVRAVIDRTSSAILIVDPGGMILHANRAAGWIIGMSAEALVGLDAVAFVATSERHRARDELVALARGRSATDTTEFRLRAADGTWRTAAISASNLLGLWPTDAILVSITDVTERREHELRLQQMVLRDPVTGLGSRRALQDALERAMSIRQPVAVAFLDLDRFKRINDCLGHTVGDEVLRAAGDRLRSMAPASSTVARFGGDTFVAVLAGVEPKRSVRTAWELIARLGNPMFIADHELQLGASVGLAIRDAASTPASMMHDAATALSRAKTTRRGGVEIFTEELRTRAVERLALEMDLRHAAERQELRVHLQPIVELATARPIGSEALVRWDRVDGSVPPAVFVPLAEETGLISAIGDLVLFGAIRAIRNGRTPRVSVNLSPRQLLDPGLPGRVERLLHSQAIAPAQVSFEITETVVIENFEIASRSLHQLRGLGCAVGLDDFGTGYSSLGYLRRLPLDFLKLDRVLVTDVDTDPQATRIAEMVIGLARVLSLTTIAEGVERDGQAEVLAAMGCDCGQGWLFGRPAPC
jgi:diguanylate cyclase (GGDEF)-like protein/PAS domain S-box-containing protein